MLTSRAYKYMKGKHNRKTSAFVKAALAYCHITAPSVSDLYTRFSLLIACAEAALYNCCLPQTDTFLKAAISLLPDLPVCLPIFCVSIIFICYEIHVFYFFSCSYFSMKVWHNSNTDSNNGSNNDCHSSCNSNNYRVFTPFLYEISSTLSFNVSDLFSLLYTLPLKSYY